MSDNEAKSADLDQIPCSAVPNLGPHCLSRTNCLSVPIQGYNNTCTSSGAMNVETILLADISTNIC